MFQSRRRLVTALIATFVLGSVLAGCSNSSGSKPAETAQPAPSQSQPAPKQNIIRITMDSDIDNLDPHAFKSDAAQMVVDATYDTFVDFGTSVDSNGAIIASSDKVVPNLAEMSISTDGKVVTFKVKSGIKFSNGDPVDAQAVADSILRGVTGDGYAKLLWGMITVTKADQVKVVDASTVQLTLEKGNLMTAKILPLALNVAMDSKVTQAHVTAEDKFGANWYKSNILGTGPYTLAKRTPGVEYQLAPAKDYWNKDKLKNDGVLVKVVPAAEERLALLKRGAVDVALGIPPKDLADLKNDPNVKVFNFASRNTNYLVMNNKIKPFDNPMVRQAVSYAMPYQTLIDKVLYGFGRPLTSPVPEGMPTHDSSSFPYKTDVAKAKQLMQQSGVGSFKTQLYVSNERTEDQQVAVWVQSALKEIGIDVEIVKIADAQFREKEGKGELPMFVEYWYSWANDPMYQLFWMFKSDNVFTNMSKYANKQVDDLINAGMYEQDATKRETISKQAQQIVINDAPIVLLYQRDYVVAAARDVKGMNLWPDQHLRFWTLTK